jgi:peptide/nickel transport system substrate-binding protein
LAGRQIVKTRTNSNLPPASSIDRRQFLATAAAGALLPAAAALLPTSAKAEDAVRGGNLRVAMTGGATSNTLDPATSTDLFEFCSNWSLRNSLVEVDADGVAQPELAESWDLSADAMTWTFKLREGVEFHNGKTLASDDVIASINHHRGDDSNSAIKDTLEQIVDIKADGTNVVVVTLKTVNLDFPYVLSDPHITVAPGGTGWEAGLGTGGYVLEEWNPGVRFAATRNPNYWKEDRAHFDRVELINVLDVAARTNALMSGDVDVCVSPDNKVYDRLAALPEFAIVELPSSGHVTIPMLTNVAPFDNPDVRLALKYAIDREEFVDKVFLGHASVGNDNPINNAYRYFAADLPQRPYDPDKAKFHLNKAGLTELRVDLSAADTAFEGAIDGAVLFAEQARKAGIEINPIREPDDGYWDNVWMKKPFCFSSWSGRSTVDWMFSVAFAADAPWNESYWVNERFNALLVAARAERDDSLRAEMYREMQVIVSDDAGVIVPAFTNYTIAGTTKLAHNKVANNWNLDGCRITERWWMGA